MDLVFPLFAFPAWVVKVDEQVVSAKVDEDTGLVKVGLPAGASTVDIELGDMPQSQLGRIISVIGLLMVALLTIADRRASNKLRHPSGRLDSAVG